MVSNCGYDATRAEIEIAAGLSYAIAFGRNFISNPDYSYRLFNRLPLNEDLNVQALYQVIDGQYGIGYWDYPNATKESRAIECKVAMVRG